jgi:uncharacterized integral membrane protein
LKIRNIIFGVPIILIVAVFVAMNGWSVTITLWPLPYEVQSRFSLVLLTIAIVSFVLGGFFFWMNSGENRKNLKKAKKELKAVKKQLEEQKNKVEKIKEENKSLKLLSAKNSEDALVSSKVKAAKID